MATIVVIIVTVVIAIITAAIVPLTALDLELIPEKVLPMLIHMWLQLIEIIATVKAVVIVIIIAALPPQIYLLRE